MKCYKHKTVDAVAQCNDCSRALCPDCAKKYNLPLCDSCVIARGSEGRKLFMKNAAIMIVLFIFRFFLNPDLDFGLRIFSALMLSGIPWGWSFLNKITPNLFWFMPVIGRAIYIFVKLMLSLLIGIFVTPFKIYQIVKALKDANDMEKYANMN